jgi:hypothetical protein
VIRYSVVRATAHLRGALISMMEWWLAGENRTKRGETSLQCSFLYQESYTRSLGIEAEPPQWEASVCLAIMLIIGEFYYNRELIPLPSSRPSSLHQWNSSQG